MAYEITGKDPIMMTLYLSFFFKFRLYKCSANQYKQYNYISILICNDNNEYFLPTQFGIAVLGEAEAIIHGLRLIWENNVDQGIYGSVES